MSDTDCMGTKAEAEQALLVEWREWTKFQQPLMARRAEYRKRDAERREADNRLRNAAAVLAWHLSQESTQ